MSGDAEKLLASLAGICGEANVSGEAQALAGYAIDGAIPRAIARPGSAKEIAEILRLCSAEKLGVVPAGSGTKLRMGPAPSRYDVALVTTRLNQVHSYDPGDLTLSVGAGARLNDLETLLEKNRQMLPLAVPFRDRATIGGTVASGIDSPLRQMHGSTRDFLLGCEFVTGDGTSAKSGGRVVKNVAGYDLHKLFIGPLGTLGVLTKLNFRTFPLAETSRAFLAAFGGHGEALGMVGEIRHSALTLSSLEILDPLLASLFARRTPPTAPGLGDCGAWLPVSGWLVAAGFGGSDAVMARYTNDLERMAGEAGTTGTAILGDDKRPALWGRLREAIPLLLDVSPATTMARASVVPSRMGELIAAARRASELHEIPAAILARGVGMIYVAFLPETRDAGVLDRLALAAGEMVEAAAAAGGFCAIPWCPAELKSRVAIWGKERADIGLIRKVKNVFDPEGILSPGRFAGGM
ncbi:MAG: FAD-binding oxidoreductase [Acidobacteriota bacterium]|nr:FAD-binding oxidoreductase [Acidobacteriota bacterium]